MPFIAPPVLFARKPLPDQRESGHHRIGGGSAPKRHTSVLARARMGTTTEMQLVDGPSNSPAGSTTDLMKGIRYPGIGKMFLVWSVIGVLTAARSQLPFGHPVGGRSFLPELVGCTFCYYPWGLLTPLVFRIEGKFPLGVPRWPRNLAILAAISIPISLLASPVMMGAFLAVQYVLGAALLFRPGYRFLISEFPLSEALFACSVAAGYFIRTLFQLHQQEQHAARLAVEKSQLEASLNQAQLDALRARLNPHFLFNSLQNISVLTKQDPEAASRMLTVLGDLLRAVLRRDSQPESTLQEEIALTRSYVALEQMRFGDRLQVTFDIANEVRMALVPCFLMQPLLENAIVHGLKGVQKNRDYRGSRRARTGVAIDHSQR